MVKQHRVLIVGAGSIGERHARCFGATDRASVAVCEVNDETRASVAQRYGVSQTFADFDAVPNESFDAAVIATPAPLHVPMATRLAQAGVHLLIEKPLSVSLEGVNPLRAIVQARRLVAAVAYVYRANPSLQAMRQAIASGQFGTPVQIVATSGQHFPTYRPAYRSIYYTRRETGGGAIQDALTHLLNAGEFLVGKIDRVMADATHQVLDGVTVEDTAHVVARHGAVLGAYSLNQYQAPNETTITVVGTQGTAQFQLHRARWRWMTTPGNDWHNEPVGTLERDAVFVAQAHAFLDAVECKAAPLCSLDEGLQTLRVNLAVLAACDRPCWQSCE
jgi:predicted dehydrogenase